MNYLWIVKTAVIRDEASIKQDYSDLCDNCAMDVGFCVTDFSKYSKKVLSRLDAYGVADLSKRDVAELHSFMACWYSKYKKLDASISNACKER